VNRPSESFAASGRAPCTIGAVEGRPVRRPLVTKARSADTGSQMQAIGCNGSPTSSLATPVDITERKRSSGTVRHVRILGLSLFAIMVAVALAGNVTSAFAAEKNEEEAEATLKFNWSKFRHCPVFESSALKKCFYASTYAHEGGEYSVGPITVPITKSISLQGGMTSEDEETGFEEIIPPTDGTQPITPVPETVPGEPLGNVTEAEMNEAGWPQALRESYAKAQKQHLFKEGKTTEVIEAAGKDINYASTFSLLVAEGTAIEAKVQIIGKNRWLESLGGNCQIGSESNPVVQHLTSGESVSPLTGEVLKGKPGYPALTRTGEMAGDADAVLVDNTYPVPGAEKCGGSANEAYLDPVVDHAFGLPAVAGASKTILIGTLYIAPKLSVIKNYF
jgi:hypothetical protein